MKTRLAIVIWWIGAFMAGCFGIGFLIALFDSPKAAVFVLPAGAIMVSLIWSICFVLTGSFLRPPR